MSLLSQHENWLSFKPFNRNSKINTRAILVPHAGIEESKTVATNVFKLIPEKYKHAIILSTNHFTKDNHILFSSKLQEYGHSFNIDNIGLEKVMNSNDEVFIKEHSWKVQIPFLTHLGFKTITPILIGNHSSFIVDELHKRIKPEHFIIVNTDLLHCGINYGNTCPSNIEDYNTQTLQNIKDYHNGLTDKLYHTRDNFKTMCGHDVMKTFLDLSKKLKLNLESIDHHSYKWDNGKHSVGYPQMHFTNQYNDEIKLLNIPRLTIEYVFNNYTINSRLSDSKKIDILNELEKKFIFQKKSDEFGIFVTIEKNGNLRGCIGTFKLTDNLGRLIAEKTLDSAFNDSRFNPISIDEINSLNYKVNFLSKPNLIFDYIKDSDKKIYEIVEKNIIIGIHGITIKFDNNKSATYLASVLIDHFNIKELTLKKWDELVLSLKKKSGGSDKIKEIEIYKCQEFSEDNKLFLEGGFYYNKQLPLMLLGLAWLSII